MTWKWEKMKSHQFPESPPVTNRWLPCWPTTYGNSNLCHTYHRKCCQALSHSSAKDLTFVGIWALFGARCQVLKGRILYLDATVDLPNNRLWRYVPSSWQVLIGAWIMGEVILHIAFWSILFSASCSVARVWAWAWVCIHYMQTTKMHTPSIFFPMLLEFSAILLQLSSTQHLALNCSFCTHQLLVPLRISVPASHLRPRWETAQPAAMWKMPSQNHWTLSIPSHHHCMSPTHGACLRIPELTVIGLWGLSQQLTQPMPTVQNSGMPKWPLVEQQYIILAKFLPVPRFSFAWICTTAMKRLEHLAEQYVCLVVLTSGPRGTWQK